MSINLTEVKNFIDLLEQVQTPTVNIRTVNAHSCNSPACILGEVHLVRPLADEYSYLMSAYHYRTTLFGSNKDENIYALLEPYWPYPHQAIFADCRAYGHTEDTFPFADVVKTWKQFYTNCLNALLDVHESASNGLPKSHPFIFSPEDVLSECRVATIEMDLHPSCIRIE